MATLEPIAPITPAGSTNPFSTQGSTFTILGNGLSGLLDFLLLIAGAVVLIAILWGGVVYISAGGDSSKAAKGLNAVKGAVIATIIIVAAWLFVNLGIILSSCLTEGGRCF